jgi:microcompartment protein CcmK/EutM
MKRVTSILVAVGFMAAVAISLVPVRSVSAAFDKNILIDDVVFNDTSTMSATQIDAFLNSKSSCISPASGFSSILPTGYSPSGGFQYGGNASAGAVIATAAQVYGLNPQVLLVTLQKEQSLVTSTSCSTNTIAKAVGYGCPDSYTSNSYSGVNLYTRNGTTYTSVEGICVNSAAKAGFSQQVIRAAWMLKFSQQRALGNTAWAIIGGSWDNSDDLSSCYSGFMTQGTYKRCPNGSATYYDGWATIDGMATHMDSGATAALYRYTPHFHGNQNFVDRFESWFGSTISSLFYACKNATNVASAGQGARVIANHRGNADAMSLIFPNNTSSACIEAHTWVPGSGYKQWMQNVATNHPAVDPADNAVISADTNGDGIGELFLVKYRGTSSGKIEIHGWDPSSQHWGSHIATNHPGVDPANNLVLAMDTDGNGRDEFVLVKVGASDSGRIEIHTWNGGEQTWRSNIAANHPVVPGGNYTVVAGDLNGDNRDELSLVGYRSTGSGKIEIHTWLPNQQAWYSNIATSYPQVDPANNSVVEGDINGDNKDEFNLVIYRGTGSGKVEIHTWLPNQQAWYSNLATSHPALAP